MKTNKVVLVLVRGWWGIAAAIGGLLWATKSVAILATGLQPDYIFELAPSLLALASLGLVLAWYREGSGTRFHVGLATLAVVAAGTASLSYALTGDDEGLFGPAMMIATLSMIVILFWVGRPLWRTRDGGLWRAIPYPLAWSFVIALPLGGLLAALNERLLEIPLLVISIEWIWLGAALISSRLGIESRYKKYS